MWRGSTGAVIDAGERWLMKWAGLGTADVATLLAELVVQSREKLRRSGELKLDPVLSDQSGKVPDVY